MKSFIVAITALAATVLAAPAPAPQGPAVPNVIFQLANDFTGANVNRQIPADGSRQQIQSLFAGTAIDNNGVFSATSAQLNAFPVKLQCAIFNDRLIATLTPQRTWADLDGDSSKLSLVSLNGAYIECNGSN